MSKILDFLTEVRVELSKVVWPTPNQAIRLTVIVIMVTITVGFFIGAVDYLLTKALELVLKWWQRQESELSEDSLEES